MDLIKADVVHSILLDSLFKDEEITQGQIPANAVIVEGVMRKVGFHKERLESHRQEVFAMLLDLPEVFQTSKGGGYSFLGACVDREGNQWGEHINIDELLMLGQGLGLAKILLPRDMWSALPGGMPYFSVIAGQAS